MGRTKLGAIGCFDHLMPAVSQRSRWLGEVKTKTNHSGGIQGGISNGEDIYFRVAFKPVATIMQKQDTINSKGEAVEMQGKGRHDACVVPRAVPIVEAMAALVIVDFLLRSKTNKI